MSNRIRLASPAHAALYPAIERSAGETFRAIPDLAWIAEHTVSPAEEYLPTIAARTVWEALTLTTFRSAPWNGPFYAGLGRQMLEAPLPDDLQALIDDENARGLHDRCAMRLAL